MLKTLPQSKRNNPRWTPLQRRTWLANERRHDHPHLLPAPVLKAKYPDLLVWKWNLANPYKWNVWLSLNGGATYMLVEDYWMYGDARQFAPDDGGEPHFIVGVDFNGKEITQHSNAVRPDDALPANLVLGFDGTPDINGNLVDLAGSDLLAYPFGDPPAYIADWTDANDVMVPHCLVSNRSGAFFQSDPFDTPNGGSKGTIALKILLPVGGSYHAFTPYWGYWSMNMVYIGSGSAAGMADDLVYVQTPIGHYLTSILSFLNDGKFHWVVFRWDTPNGFYDLSVDGLTETATLEDFNGVVYPWPESMTFQSCAPWESDEYINVISQIRWFDAPLSDYEKDDLIAT